MATNYLHPTSQNHTQLHKTTPNFTKPHPTLQNHTQLHKTTPNLTKPHPTSQNHTQPLNRLTDKTVPTVSTKSMAEEIKKTPAEDDKQWVEEAVAGSQKAFRQLSQKYQTPLTHHIRRMVKDEDDIADLVQETFVKAFQSLQSYSTQYAFSTWIYKIATNHTIDFIRKKRLKTISIHQPIDTKDGQVEFEIPDEQYRPDKHLVEDERSEILKTAISSLPEKYHKVIMMRHVSEKSYEEISEELGIPLGTVKAHIFRAREMLYKALKDQRENL